MLRDRGSENEDEPGVTTVKDSPLVLLREGNTGRDTLLFSDPATRTRRLVVPTSELRREVLEMAHDNATHQGLLHPYGRASKGFYWRGMVRLIKEYIAHCRPCQRNKNLTHRPYAELRLIESPTEPFHMISIDLITDLPKDCGKDAIMSFTSEGHFFDLPVGYRSTSSNRTMLFIHVLR